MHYVSLLLQNWLALIFSPLMNDSPADVLTPKIVPEFQSLYFKRHITVPAYIPAAGNGSSVCLEKRRLPVLLSMSLPVETWFSGYVCRE